MLGQQLGGSQQGGHMNVMTAGVHHTGFVGGEGESGLLLYRQGVHVGAEGHGAARAAAPQQPYYGGIQHGLNLNAVFLQKLLDQL